MIIKGIIFDLDNTIYNYTDAHNNALNILLNHISLNYNINIEQLDYNKYNKIIKNNLGDNTASSHNKILTIKLLCEDLLIPCNDLIKLYEIYNTTFLDNMKCYDNVIDFLKLCKKNNIKICILTDYSTEFTYRKIEKLSIFEYINYIITSEEVGYDKPNKLMFYTALDKLKLNKNEVLMIGDNYEKDIIGANNIDIYGLWFSKKNMINKYHIEFNNYNYIHNLFNNLFNELQILIDICKYCGDRFDLVQAGGGNISFKYNNLMIIKSSGCNLSKVNKYNNYSILNNINLLNDIQNDAYNNLDDYLLITKNKASIESYMHSFLKKYVIHLHPIAVNIILCKKDAKNIIKELFKDSLFIDYILPGKELSKNIFDKYNNEEIIFLKNHGIIITCNEIDRCYILINDIINKCESYTNVNLDKYKILEIKDHLFPDSVIYNKKNYEIYKSHLIILNNNKRDDLDFLSKDDVNNILNYEKDRIKTIFS